MIVCLHFHEDVAAVAMYDSGSRDTALWCTSSSEEIEGTNTGEI
jgi:hypothetical protein